MLGARILSTALLLNFIFIYGSDIRELYRINRDISYAVMSIKKEIKTTSSRKTKKRLHQELKVLMKKRNHNSKKIRDMLKDGPAK